MLSFLLGIPGMLGGLFSSVDKITAAISDQKIALINATTDREKIEIQERISALQSQQSVLIADSQKSSIDLWLRFVAGIGPISIVCKIFLWDKVIGSLAGCVGKNTPATCDIFTTDPVTTEQWVLVGVVYGFLFVHSMVKS